MESLQEKDLEPVSHKWYKAGGPPKGRSERTATSRQDMPQHAPASRWEEPRHAPHPSEKPLPQRPIPSHPRGQAPTPRGYLGWGKKQRTVDPEMGEMSEMRGGPPMVAARA